MRRQLVLMLREPRPGRVKTRLGREIGMVAAAHWARRLAARLIRRLEDPRWDLILSVTPDRAVDSPAWPPHIRRLPQGPGDLGQRMTRLLQALPPGPVAIVGSDVPGLTRGHAARAFAALGGCEAVIGPARDGGYWLIGMHRVRAVPAGLLGGVAGPRNSRRSTRWRRCRTAGLPC